MDSDQFLMRNQIAVRTGLRHCRQWLVLVASVAKACAPEDAVSEVNRTPDSGPEVRGEV